MPDPQKTEGQKRAVTIQVPAKDPEKPEDEEVMDPSGVAAKRK